MSHYICTGGCKGVSNEAKTCGVVDCPKHGTPLEPCNCTDGKHYGKLDQDNVNQDQTANA